MSEKRSGHVCAVPNCFIKSYNSKKKFYRFPKDPERARIWVMNASREDFLQKLTDLYKSYRLCENHFEENMFTNHLHTRLVASAIPTLFPSLEGSSRFTKDDHTYSAPPLLSAEKRVPAIAETDLADQTVPFDTKLEAVVQTEGNSLIVASPPLMSPMSTQSVASDTEHEAVVQTERNSLIVASPPLMSPISTQTSTSLTSDTPRKIQFRQKIKSLTAENKYLRQRVQVLENQMKKKLDNISLHQYMSLTFKFCSSVETAKRINMQVAQGIKKAKGRRYR